MLYKNAVFKPAYALNVWRRLVSIIADMIVSGFEGVMSINGVYNSSRGKLYTCIEKCRQHKHF